MKPEELKALLTQLIASWENESVEFKQVGNDYDTDKIGRYFSALCNESNLRGQEQGWLIFGVENKNRRVVGSDYRLGAESLNALKQQISKDTGPGLTFRDIHVVDVHGKRVIMFEIPPAPLGIPISWKGHWYSRAGESLTPLGIDKLDTIRSQTISSDWSAALPEGAKIQHLDSEALARAKESFALKYANRFSEGEVQGWPDATFLNRARLTIDGQITRAALLLLGRAESAHLLLPHPAQMTWRLQTTERAYEHFGPPFLLNSSRLYRNIRNVQVRVLPEDQLLAVEVAKYDQKIVLEALHNCIAHQDYRRNGRIVVTEQASQLVFENEGSFFEGQPLDYLAGHKTPRRYRNPFLAQAMAELNMIDTMGYGIHEMFLGQARRFFPLPDFDLSDPQAVKITILGGVVDPAYTRALIKKTDLCLRDILALDRVQKRLPLDEETIRHLKRLKLIEGRKPHFHVSASIAEISNTKAAYIKTRTLDDRHYRKLVVEYLEKFGHASREDLDGFLLAKLGDALDAKQKQTKIGNLLTGMRKEGVMHNTGSRGKPRWQLVERIKKNEKE